MSGSTSPGAGAANASPGSLAGGSVFITRDCVHFRTTKSPVAVLAARFFALLASQGDLSVNARKCFYPALLDHIPPDNGVDATLDAQIKSLFASPPQVVLIQGPFKVDGILEEPPMPGTPKSASTISSSFTALNGPTNLADVVFAGFTLHNELVRCSREDKDQYGRLSFFALAVLAHESAHWIFTKIHGYRTDMEKPRARAGSQGSGIMAAMPQLLNGGSGREDPLIALSGRPEDCGTRATDMLIGCSCKMISFADGDTEVVKRKIQPPISSDPPVLAGKTLEDVLGARVPQMTDITGHAPVTIGGSAPAWSTHDTYLVTSLVAANSFCAHGVCRIGKLF